ncbi:MAG TPA: uroporphyrinogen decarboxylase family protein [Candidatus Aminicenantes bacterium]|nr:uroporphyrinogen decarboxylase family protein [Candidatus Aminicenantes bacterium]HRY65786.1 uroporphyrinogen decarboxylase family protein [Candidatus Aminicenantes bacterium]HRZ72700.1 uroporphyrinogen decarboxylase family protein [Candidatus Aminicenantes bacterium]
MTSKERVTAVLEGRIPDRVPYAEFAVDFDTVERLLGHETFLRAKARSQIAFWAGRHDEVAQSWREDHIALHKKLPLDIVTFPMATWELPPPDAPPPPRRIDAVTWEDREGRIFRLSEATQDITCVHDPVRDARVFTAAEFEREPEPVRRDERSWAILDAVVRELKDEKFIAGPSGGSVGIVLLGGLERGLFELAANPEAVRAATRQLVRRENAADEALIHPDADAVLWADDLGFKTGPLIGPAMFRDFFLEANRERVGRIKGRYGLKVLQHCCGNINLLLDQFVGIGYDAYQSIQPTAGMDLGRLKREYGGRITLWGGVAVENLVAGSPEDVRADVRRAMACAKPGGRFILGSSHSVAVGAKYDNFMALLDEHAELCQY